MHTLIILSADTVSGTLDPKAAAVWGKGFLLLCAVVVVIWISIKAWLKHGQNGNISGSASFVAAFFICTIPLGLVTTGAILTGTGGMLADSVFKILGG